MHATPIGASALSSGTGDQRTARYGTADAVRRYDPPGYGRDAEHTMRIIGTLLSLAWIVLILLDSFETILQPRRVTHRFRFARLFYRVAWKVWRAGARRISPGRRRESYVSVFGPLSLLALLTMWFASLVVGFGLLHWSLGTVLHAPESRPTLLTYLYFSGTSFFTLGYGDVTPSAGLGRVLAVVEGGLGFGFLAAMISYLPVLYQAFSRREVTISLMDARAGSPPSAAEALLRAARAGDVNAIRSFLDEWERWSAELLESQLTFPVLSYYRSQHDNQSWLAALTTILDTCALLMAGVKGVDAYQAGLTFAMARHAAVDLALVFSTPPRPPDPDRAPPTRRAGLRQTLGAARLPVRQAPAADPRLPDLRALHEPFVNALAAYFL